MENDIQIHGQLGIPPEDIGEQAAPTEVIEQLVPHYTVQQHYFPKTGELTQGYIFSLLGILLVLLAIWLRHQASKSKIND
ncbi:hypothetical protein [Enterococcus sp. AZ109]|uniref:hypothetical protein n=1 Tax=Enterococcus sp. AZ109 TaxID=2774634 RepID=UPI003F28A169